MVAWIPSLAVGSGQIIVWAASSCGLIDMADFAGGLLFFKP
jgi:hypothetical protein